MSKRKIIVAVVLLFVVAVAVVRIKSKSDMTSQKGKQQQGLAVRVSNPQTGTLTVTRSFTGEVAGKDQSSVFPEAEGRLSRYLVAEGDKVNKDQIIANVDREMTGMDFEELRVRAPVAGTVTRLYHNSGDTVSRQTPLAVIAKLDEVKVAFHIPEKDLQFVRRGNPVMLKVSSRPGKTFSGSVERISLSLDRATRSAYAEALFKNSSRSLMPGMFAEIEVVSRTIKNALLIPENTVLRDPLEQSFFVFTVDKENKSVKQTVEIGERQDGLIRILSGLKSEDRVVVEGQDFLKEGEDVRIIK